MINQKSVFNCLLVQAKCKPLRMETINGGLNNCNFVVWFWNVECSWKKLLILHTTMYNILTSWTHPPEYFFFSFSSCRSFSEEAFTVVGHSTLIFEQSQNNKRFRNLYVSKILNFVKPSFNKYMAVFEHKLQ